MKKLLTIFMLITFENLFGQTSPNLVGFWRFEGNANDASGNGNNGSFTVSPPSLITGKFGNAYSFNGVNNGINCGNDSSLSFNTGNYTVLFWVKTSDGTTSTVVRLVNKWGTVNGFFISYTPNAHTLTAGWFNGLNVIKNLSDNIWHHIAFERTGATSLSIYCDGILIGSKSNEISRTVDNTTYLYFGYIPYTSAYGWLNGQLDEIKLYNRALTEGEIRQDMLNFAPGEF